MESSTGKVCGYHHFCCTDETENCKGCEQPATVEITYTDSQGDPETFSRCTNHEGYARHSLALGQWVSEASLPTLHFMVEVLGNRDGARVMIGDEIKEREGIWPKSLVESHADSVTAMQQRHSRQPG